MSAEDIYFYGHDGQNLDRLVALAQFKFLAEDAYYVAPPTAATATAPASAGGDATIQSGYLITRFRGAALDWAVAVSQSNPRTLINFRGFVTACKEHFGISDETVQIMRRGELDSLRWGHDVAVFFAEFDRLTFGLGINSDEAKITMVSSKLPAHVNKLLAEQALVFNSYSTMRQRIITMWALGAFGKSTDAATCSMCGKRGHNASNCRSLTKN